MAGENIPQTDTALLRAQSEAGPAGVAAYQAAKEELARTQSASLGAAVGNAAARGGPAGAMDAATQEAANLYQRRQDSLTQGQARAGVREANRTQRMGDYTGAVNEARVLIGDQVQGQLAPMRLQSEYSLQQMRQQGDNTVGQIRSQMDLDAAKYAAELRAAEQQAALEQQRWEQEMAQREAIANRASAEKAASEAKAAAEKKQTLTGPELTSMLTAGARAKIEAAMQNAGQFLESKNTPSATSAVLGSRNNQNPNHILDPLHIGSPRNQATSTQRGTTAAAPIQPGIRPALNPNHVMDPRIIGTPVVPVPGQRPTLNPNHVMDPRVIGNPAVPRARTAGDLAREPLVMNPPAVSTGSIRAAAGARPTLADHVRDPRFIGGPAVPAKPENSIPGGRAMTRPSGPGDATYSGPGSKTFTKDELDFFLNSPEGALFAPLAGYTGQRSPTTGEGAAEMIGQDPNVFSDAMWLAAADLQAQGYDVSEAEIRAAMGTDDTFKAGSSYADVFGRATGLGSVSDQLDQAKTDLTFQQGQDDRTNRLNRQGIDQFQSDTTWSQGQEDRNQRIIDRQNELDAKNIAEGGKGVEAQAEADLLDHGIMPGELSDVPVQLQQTVAKGEDDYETWNGWLAQMESLRTKTKRNGTTLTPYKWSDAYNELVAMGLDPSDRDTRYMLAMMEPIWNAGTGG